MKSQKKAAPAKIAPVVRSILIGVVTYIVLTALLLLGTTPEQHDIQIGAPSTIDILASKDVNDTVTTEANREAAAAAVEPSYRSVDSLVVASVVSDMEASFDRLLALRDGTTPDETRALSDEALAALNARLPIDITREQYAALLAADGAALEELTSAAIEGVRDALNTTLPEGQENSAVSRISRALYAQGYPQDLVPLATGVIRECIRPNMLIDEEITEANRQKARDEVETVTCVKGEVIVRRGEIVTQAQYTMLSSLGLLTEDSLDIHLIGGIALIVLLVMSCLALYLLRYHPEQLAPKPLTLLCLIAVLVTGINLAISRWNPYMMPISLGTMLVFLLINRRLSMYFSIALGLIASLMTDASSGYTISMLPIVLMSMACGPVIMTVFSNRMQRVTTLLAGVCVGIANFLCTLSIGLINSAETSTVLSNALWAMGGGIFSAVLCIGFQPLLELLFNLATNSKLIELSNPNQPLLRRLLLEAPGTYHHSIIVANLAEAATAAVGGNDLLARVGAYYHDIGKLKRPMYFKENQMGDNPHDRTDPRVSAAIVTAHPRDGAAMAQKARIPEPVLDIIRQHHGDSVPLWFYDKAVKLYGSDNVDINAFRYEGPRPRTKEAACVMLADTIEAAARSIPEPTPEKIDALIRKLVHNTLNGGQLDESPLTFRDLERICSAFSTVLTGVFHERIEYPDIQLPPRVERPEAEDKPAEPATERKAEAEAPKAANTPADNKPAEPKPAETKPAEAKPAPEAAEPAPAARTGCEMRITVEPIMPPKPVERAGEAKEAAQDAH